MDKNSALFKWLFIVSVFGIGNKRIWEYVKNADELDKYCELIKSLNNLTVKEKENVKNFDETQIASLYKYCQDNDIQMICISDNEYPQRLKNIYNPPAVLFCKGDLSVLKRELVLSVVGTRKPSEYSIKVANALVKGLCKNEFTLVSGFAEGIDIVSHISAIRNGGKTAAVLANGIDYDYPQKNIKYRSEILKNGVFISEYFPKTNPSKIAFPCRNRILSGLSLGTIVIEAGEKSGSLVTANLALGQGKDVFAVPPHDLFDVRYMGNAKLLRDGALPIYGLQDVTSEYFENFSHKITSTKQAAVADLNLPSEKPEKVKSEPKIKYKYQSEENPKIEFPVADISVLQDDEKIIAEILQKSVEPVLPDDIAALSNMEITAVLSTLISLELDGVVSRLQGGKYQIMS